MATESQTATTTSSATSQLGTGRLRLFDALAQSVALLALIMGLALTTNQVAAFADAAAPLAYLLAGLGSLCLAYVFIRFTRAIAHAGSIYTYVSKGLGPEVGFLGGWLYTGAFGFGVSFTLAISSFYASELLANINVSVDWFPLFLVGVVLLFLFAFFDIRISTRFLLVAAAIDILVTVVLVVAILGKGGAEGLSAQPFNPGAITGGFSSLFFAVIYGFTAFGGFEAAASLGEETSNPRRAIPQAILVAILVGLVFYILSTYAFSVGYGVDHADKWATDGAPLDTLANQYVGSALATIIDTMVAIGAFIASLAGLNMAARILFAMGRDRGLPAFFGMSHPRFKTPWVAIVFCLVLTAVLGTTLGRTMDSIGGAPLPQPVPFFIFIATTATLGILSAYLLVALSGLVFFQRSKEATGAGKIWQVILPVVAILICGAALFSSIKPLPPAPDLVPPLSNAPLVFAVWLLLGIILVVVLRVVNPAQVRKFGQIVAGAGEEAATEPSESASSS